HHLRVVEHSLCTGGTIARARFGYRTKLETLDSSNIEHKKTRVPKNAGLQGRRN
ncbi:MAG: hypothetical protein ACI9UU_003678, partial [Candidatus Azotimanducaceae bacterium]